MDRAPPFPHWGGAIRALSAQGIGALNILHAGARWSHPQPSFQKGDFFGLSLNRYPDAAIGQVDGLGGYTEFGRLFVGAGAEIYPLDAAGNETKTGYFHGGPIPV